MQIDITIVQKARSLIISTLSSHLFELVTHYTLSRPTLNSAVLSLRPVKSPANIVEHDIISVLESAFGSDISIAARTGEVQINVSGLCKEPEKLSIASERYVYVPQTTDAFITSSEEEENSSAELEDEEPEEDVEDMYVLYKDEMKANKKLKDVYLSKRDMTEAIRTERLRLIRRFLSALYTFVHKRGFTFFLTSDATAIIETDPMKINVELVKGKDAIRLHKLMHPDWKHGGAKRGSFTLYISELSMNQFLDGDFTLRWPESKQKMKEEAMIVPIEKDADLDLFGLKKIEIDILRFICEELSNKEIAKQLNVSSRYVEDIRMKMAHKLNLKNTAGLVRFALRNGIFVEDGTLDEKVS